MKLRNLKKWLTVALSLITIFSFSSCGTDKDFEKLANSVSKEQNYAGVRYDLTLVSNKYPEKNLKKAGLPSNAEFIYGTDSEMYFFVKVNSLKGQVFTYAFETDEITKIAEHSGADADFLGGGDDSIISAKMKDENSIYWFHVVNTGRLGYHKYNLDVYHIDMYGNQLHYERQSIDKENQGETKAAQYMRGVKNYYLAREANGSIVGQQKIYHGNESFIVQDITEGDLVWQTLNEATSLGGYFFEPTSNGLTAIRRSYTSDNLFKTKYDCYFVAPFKGEASLLFIDKEPKSQIEYLYAF